MPLPPHPPTPPPDAESLRAQVIDSDPQLLLHVYLNAKSNACKYGKQDGIVATEIVLRDEELTLRVINEPGPYHEQLRLLPDPSTVFRKGTRFHAETSPEPTARTSTGDGAWIMQRCAECLQGSCSISFEPSRTVFELRCPALERVDDNFLDHVYLGEDVWCIGVDDCFFQRYILEQLFTEAGVIKNQVRVYGETADQLRNVSGTLVHLVQSLPHKLILAIIDENLDLPDCSASVSGSHAIQEARRRLAPADEARLMAFVRSANDSASDQQLYSERSHGFLSKSPGPAGRKALFRAWINRFGTSSLRKSASAEHSTTTPDASRIAASREMDKYVRNLDGWRLMRWSEVWMWLHRMKGILASSQSGGNELRTAVLMAEIEALRALEDFPPNFVDVWNKIRAGAESYMQELAYAA